MNNDMKWAVACRVAQAITGEWRRQFPNSRGVMGFTTGGGQTDTTFSRVGTSQTDGSTLLTQNLIDLLTANATGSAPDAALGGTQRSFLSTLLGRNQDSTPGRETLDSNMAINPTTYTGSPTLSVIAARNPYSTQFEQDTQASFEQRAADTMAQLQTGHEAVRGGQSRSGIAQGVAATRLAQERGREVREAQMQDAGIVGNAIAGANAIESGRRGVQLTSQSQLGGQSVARTGQGNEAARTVDSARNQHSAALDLAGKLLGLRRGLVTDNLSGQGTQGTSSWSTNILGNCCFIFLEALNGKLPPCVEAARIEFHTPVRRRGYKWMSNWLVPLMRRSVAARHVVNVLIVRPCLIWGEYHYGYARCRWRALLRPYVFALFHLWAVLGSTVGRKIQ